MSGTTKKKEEETAVSSVTEETTVILGRKIGTGSEYRGSIDLLAALQLHNTTYNGVKQVPGGLYRLKPTYNLDGESFSAVRLSPETFSRPLSVLRHVFAVTSI